MAQPLKSTRTTTTRRPPATPRTPRLSLVSAAVEAGHGVPKANAALLFERIASGSAIPVGKLRSAIIPEASWKRAQETLPPTASQTAARLDHILNVAKNVWGNEPDAVAWLNTPHPELTGATPYSMLRTESGGRTVETLLVALDHGFPV